MGLDGDPAANGQLEQTIMGLTSGQKYTLSFDWAGIELSNRTGYNSIQLTGSFGGDAFATSTYSNTASAGQPGSFSDSRLEHGFLHRGSSSSELLSFLAVGTPAGNVPPFALLDGVSLTAVPEPATWAMMLIAIQRSRLCRLPPPPAGSGHRIRRESRDRGVSIRGGIQFRLGFLL